MFRTALIAIFSLVLWGCSGGAQTEKTQPDAHAETPESTASTEASNPTTPGGELEGDKVDKSALASCTGGNVPVGATKCRLDLETGQDSYWSDSDGVNPGNAGCHLEYADNACGVIKPGREFGEFCLDSDRLVESNPGAEECHTHKGDLGAPNVTSCSEWCKGQQFASGKCEAAMGSSLLGTCESAHCVCS